MAKELLNDLNIRNAKPIDKDVLLAPIENDLVRILRSFNLIVAQRVIFATAFRANKNNELRVTNVCCKIQYALAEIHSAIFIAPKLLVVAVS